MDDLDVIWCGIARLVNGECLFAELLGVAPAVMNGLYVVGFDVCLCGCYVMVDSVFQRCVALDFFCGEYWFVFVVMCCLFGGWVCCVVVCMIVV